VLVPAQQRGHSCLGSIPTPRPPCHPPTPQLLHHKACTPLHAIPSSSTLFQAAPTHQLWLLKMCHHVSLDLNDMVVRNMSAVSVWLPGNCRVESLCSAYNIVQVCGTMFTAFEEK
jgi:hypothetical protein